jgi:hypothetical protein
MVGQLSTRAANGPAADAVKLGAGVVETATGKVACVGALAQSPEQMEQAGILKPGSAKLIAKLVADGKTVEEAMTSNLFTGMPGAENLQAYISNTTAQCAAQVVTLQKAQTALTNNGLITGKESGTQIAGLVMSAATAGVANTVNFVKNAANSALSAVSSITGAASGALNSVLGSASSLVSAGNFAGNLASTVTGGLSSIAGALGGMAKGAIGGIAGLLDSAKGVAGSAFAAITGAFPTLKAGVPQNIKDITEKAQAAAQAPASANPLTGALSAVTGAINSVTGGALSSVTGAINSVTGAVSGVVGSATNLIKSTLGATPGLASGLNALPGGEKTVASIVDNAIGAVNTVPGVSAVTGLINTAAIATQGLSNLTSINPLASSGALNAATNIASGLTKGLDDLKSGKTSLASLASAGLPAAAAAQLNSAISSMSSGGAVPIKLPTIAINTNDRSELTSQITSVLGDAKIPMPNFSGNPATTGNTEGESLLAAAEAKAVAEIEKLSSQSSELQQSASEAKTALDTAKNSLPQGDPTIASLESAHTSIKENLTEVDSKLKSLQQAQIAKITIT